MMKSASFILAEILGMTPAKKYPLVKVRWAANWFGGRKLYYGRHQQAVKVARLYCMNPGLDFAARPLNTFETDRVDVEDYVITPIGYEVRIHH